VEGVTPEPAFWDSKRVLVTGHTGFKGSWLSLWLQSLGADVAGYSIDVPTTPSLYESAGVGAEMTSVEGDVADSERLAEVIDVHSPDVVFHLAAQALVRDSYRMPVETFRTNVIGTATVLEAARRHDATRVVISVTSDKCYRNRGEDVAYGEDAELGGDDPYSASKAAAEMVTGAYRTSFLEGPDSRLAVASVRAGNVVGGGDWAADRLVPDAIRAAQSGEPLRVRHPDAIRPWQYVLDCLAGYLVLAERLWKDRALPGAWNFGPDEADVRPVRWIADEVARLWGSGLTWRAEPPAAGLGEAATLRLDSSRARALLGWQPQCRIDEALELAVEWYRAASAPSSGPDDVRRITLDQLGAYTRRGAEAR